MIKLKIRYLCIMTLMVATIAFYSVKNDVLAKTTGGGPTAKMKVVMTIAMILIVAMMIAVGAKRRIQRKSGELMAMQISIMIYIFLVQQRRQTLY